MLLIYVAGQRIPCTIGLDVSHQSCGVLTYGRPTFRSQITVVTDIITKLYHESRTPVTVWSLGERVKNKTVAFRCGAVDNVNRDLSLEIAHKLQDSLSTCTICNASVPIRVHCKFATCQRLCDEFLTCLSLNLL